MFKDGSVRRWMVQAFYPTLPHSETSSYMPGMIKNGIVEGTAVKTHSKLNSPQLTGQMFPAIIFVPGIGSSHLEYTILFENLASHGYIVLSIGEPYISNFVNFPDGSAIVYRLLDAWKHMMRSDRDYRYQYFDDAMDSAISDITYMLDHLNDISQTYFQDTVNLGKITLMGHSFGGNVAHTLGFNDARIKTIVDIDSKITERKIHGILGLPENKNSKPIFLIRGMMQYQEDLGDHLEKVSNAKIWKPYVQHGAFSDSAFFVRAIQDYGKKGLIYRIINYLFKWGPEFDAVDTNLGGQSYAEWNYTYHHKIIDWLKVIN
jgi:pimeloyl-ACP methyl ester carboxylesterase